MSTDIHGGIEFRHPGVGTDYYDGEPWVAAMDLWPLYDQVDHVAFGCLFGVRNDAGFSPLAARRGLPEDLSPGLCEQLQHHVETGCLTDATWVSWADLAAIDPASAPDHYLGRLTLQPSPQRGLLKQQLVPAQWPEEVLRLIGPPPPNLERSGSRSTSWISGKFHCHYEPLTAGAILGDESGWPHVFAVMKALADRFGEDAVRLVVAFG